MKSWGDGGEVTTAIPDGADFGPTSLGSAKKGDADNATTTGVIAAGPVTDIDVGTAGDLFPNVVGFDPDSAWDDGDEVTAAIAAAGATRTVATTVAAHDVVDFEPAGAHKRKRKHKQRHTVQDARKHQRRQLSAIRGSAPGTDTGFGVRRQSDDT